MPIACSCIQSVLSLTLYMVMLLRLEKNTSTQNTCQDTHAGASHTHTANSCITNTVNPFSWCLWCLHNIFYHTPNYLNAAHTKTHHSGVLLNTQYNTILRNMFHFNKCLHSLTVFIFFYPLLYVKLTQTVSFTTRVYLSRTCNQRSSALCTNVIFRTV